MKFSFCCFVLNLTYNFKIINQILNINFFFFPYKVKKLILSLFCYGVSHVVVFYDTSANKNKIDQYIKTANNETNYCKKS